MSCVLDPPSVIEPRGEDWSPCVYVDCVDAELGRKKRLVECCEGVFGVIYCFAFSCGWFCSC